MTVIFPMNGKGERFKKAGFNIPKPILPIGEERLIQKVYKTYKCKDLSIIQIISETLGKLKPFENLRLNIIPFDTSGPLETILSRFSRQSVFSDDILKDEEILIADCDSFFEDPKELWDAVEEFRKSKLLGGVTVRETNDPGCSYANFQILPGYAFDFREKDPYTPWSSTGPYYWKSWDTFYKCALQAYWDGVTSIAPVYNYLKEPVRAVEVQTFVHLGTPEAYLAYCRRTNV